MMKYLNYHNVDVGHHTLKTALYSVLNFIEKPCGVHLIFFF